jgi:hypothetical protein
MPAVAVPALVGSLSKLRGVRLDVLAPCNLAGNKSIALASTILHSAQFEVLH